MIITRHALPLFVFVLILVFLAIGLKLNPREVPSPLINKPAPYFSLPQLNNSKQLVNVTSFLGKVWFFNVWASWCAGCKVEHEVLVKMSHQGATIIGLNYKDQNDAANQWLQDSQNPYQMVLIDEQGDTGINWGVYGVPETFLIGKQGKIQAKHIGPLNEDDAQQLLTLARKLQNES